MFKRATVETHRNRGICQNRRGAAAVEFAVVAPLFLLLLAGIIEFGQAFRIEHLLSNACRRGCRAAVVEGPTTEQVRDKIKSQCVDFLGVSAADIDVQVAVNGNSSANLADAEQGAEISVTVSVPFSKAGAGFYAKLFSTSTLASTCTLERE
jgi:Flp pilus assembly protein TadG